MYLAKLYHGATLRYEIRTSNKNAEGLYDYRRVFHLGTDPSQYFRVVSDRALIFDDNLIEALVCAGSRKPGAVLEKLLFPFFPRYIQKLLLTFRDRSMDYKGRLSDTERQQIAREVHLFDRKRLYYLRYGAVDQSRLSRLHEKCCRPLLGQSRDEREYYFTEEEKVLEPGSFFQYIFAIFDLQKYFHQSFAPWLPEALVREEVDEQFVKAVCSLQKDRIFWQAEQTSRFLHPHLQRYVWMFFDYTPYIPSFQQDFVRNFMRSRRNFKWPERTPKATPEKIQELFGVAEQRLAAMTKPELTRLYRKKALELHPDTGGDAELFISLTDIYNSFIQKK